MEFESVRRQPNEFGLQIVVVTMKPTWLERLTCTRTTHTLVRQGFRWSHIKTLLPAHLEMAEAADKALQRGTHG